MNPINLMQMIGQIKSNPVGVLSKKFNLPQNLNNPQDIIQHLMNTGQVTQQQYNQAMNMAKQLKK